MYAYVYCIQEYIYVNENMSVYKICYVTISAIMGVYIKDVLI